MNKLEAELLKPGDFVRYATRVGIVTEYAMGKERVRFIGSEGVEFSVPSSSPALRRISDEEAFLMDNPRRGAYKVRGVPDLLRVTSIAKSRGAICSTVILKREGENFGKSVSMLMKDFLELAMFVEYKDGNP